MRTLTNKKWLLIDTDAGIDDAVALCMAMRLGNANGFELKLVTTNFGNCSLEQVCQNVAKCRAACEGNAGLRIVRGADRTVGGKAPSIDASYFHGKDGLGDAGLPEVPEDAAPGYGPDEIVSTCRAALAAGATATLLALGPLTNVALALRAEPGLSGLLDKLIVMGGCGNARGNTGRVTEFNVMADPEAAAAVFKAEWREITVVPWELCDMSHVPWHAFDSIFYGKSAQRTNVGRFLAAILRSSFVEHREMRPMVASAPGALETCCFAPLVRLLGGQPLRPPHGAVICDAVAMLVCLREDSVLRCCQVHVDVELDGALTRGMTVVDYGSTFETPPRKRNVLWVQEVDVALYQRLLRQMLTG